MEYGYNPEGWLGILIGSSLYFDFARDSKYNTSISGLLKEIERKDSGGQVVTESKAGEFQQDPLTVDRFTFFVKLLSFYNKRFFGCMLESLRHGFGCAVIPCIPVG